MTNPLLLNILEGKDLLGIPLFDQDLYKLALLMAIHLVVSFILIRLIYYPFSEKRRQYLFAFILISTMVFFLAFALKSFKFNVGIALGLFAVFGIVRFRTSPMPIKEMSYLFTIMGVALINALSNKLSLSEVLIIDGVILVTCYLMEVFVSLSNPTAPKKIMGLEYKDIVYGWLENVKPQNREALIEDLKDKTGLDIKRIETKDINLRRGEAVLRVFYTAVDGY